MTPQRGKILVVEDDPAILQGLVESLSMASYEVVSADDGAEGYRLAQDSQPDLIILDLMLPHMNGYDICRKIRSHGLATPILMLTAQNQETNRIDGFDAGADDYVTKPFSIHELLRRVQAILRRSEGRSDLANQKELDEARRIQQRLMPTVIPQVPGFGIAAVWRPARIASGDYYDVIRLGDGAVALCIADVCGKGMPAAMMVSSLQAAMKACASKSTPAELCAAVNRIMCQNLASSGFITFFYAVLDPATRKLTYSNAGHNPPVVWRTNPQVRERNWTNSIPGITVRALRDRLSGSPRTSGPTGRVTARLFQGGPVLGVLQDAAYEQETIQLSPGDGLLLYTDGITESRNQEEEFGEERLLDLITRFETRKPNAAAALTEAVVNAASEFSHQNFEDDLTVLAATVL